MLLPQGEPAGSVRVFRRTWCRGHGGLSVLGAPVCLKWWWDVWGAAEQGWLILPTQFPTSLLESPCFCWLHVDVIRTTMLSKHSNSRETRKHATLHSGTPTLKTHLRVVVVCPVICRMSCYSLFSLGTFSFQRTAVQAARTQPEIIKWLFIVQHEQKISRI